MSEARRAGCISTAVLVRSIGHLPQLDLDGRGDDLRSAGDRALARSGCRLLVPAVDPFPGVRIVRADVEAPGGDVDLLLAYTGPARLRVLPGPAA